MTKETTRKIFTGAFVLSGVMHFFNPQFFKPLIPKKIPYRNFGVYISGVLELVLAVGLWVKDVRVFAGWGTALLMWLFLPIHIVDLFREKPVVGSKPAAFIRLIAQFGLIKLAHDLTEE